MKNLLFVLFSFVIGLSGIVAQEPEKDVKKADRLLGIYLLDTKSNADKLKEAKDLIDAAYTQDAVSGMYKTWLTRGKVYNEVAGQDNMKLVVNPKAKIESSLAAVTALESFEKAMSLAIKGFEKKDVIEGLNETAQYLNNFGSVLYSSGDVLGAFRNFDGVLKANQLITANGGKAILQSQDDINRQKYIAAVCALSAKQNKEAASYFEDLAAANYNDSTGAGAVVYESLYSLYSTTDDAKAEKYLSEGRKKYPNETNLLFAEINHFLKKGKLDELIDKLKLAIAREPNNLSIYNTLGNVYDNLCQKEWEKQNNAKAEEYLNESMKYYNQVLEKDPSNGNATYSIGALYYNRAAITSKEMNLLANDYTKEGSKKYEAKKAEMIAYFDKALPYFEKSEKLDPNDVNTLVALKEIYAKKGDFEKSNKYKEKLEAMKK
jgi:tetratricopeptide (TPR) repeat protein